MTTRRNKTESFDTASHSKHVTGAPKFVKKLKRNKQIYGVAHFDLPRSTKKMIDDQPKAITEMLLHNRICSGIVKENGGRVIKELGDAVLATFQDAPTACECGLKVIHNLKKRGKGIHTKVTITAGTIEKISTDGKPDVYGLAVNLCNRMAKKARVDAVIIEETRFREVKDWLPPDKKIKFGRPKWVKLDDFGYLELRDITLDC
ncbi:MAG: nucleotidyl cyclase domain-containing protein [Nitrosotalea sp.]